MRRMTASTAPPLSPALRQYALAQQIGVISPRSKCLLQLILVEDGVVAARRR